MATKYEAHFQIRRTLSKHYAFKEVNIALVNLDISASKKNAALRISVAKLSQLFKK